MSTGLVVEDWRLKPAIDEDIDELMGWFDTQRSINEWGGPNFRYPFDRETFVEDCHWPDMATYCVYSEKKIMCAFGQLYERDRRINLARLIAHPHMRGQGIGRRLVTMLMTIGVELFELKEYSLFVYRDNAPALKCYQSLGFEMHDYPPDESMADVCYYLTRSVVRPE